jgi:3-hexulose-6-phosphate synthase/6-phospho-3-hexuloisomerase
MSFMDTAGPILQLALDFANLAQALRMAEEAVEGGAQWLEAGTPLIKSEGLNAVRALREKFPHHTIVADMKTMDAGREEVEMAAKAGANVVAVLGAASDATIEQAVEAGLHYDAQIMIDTAELADPVGRAIRASELGASIINVHCPIDVQMRGGDPFETLKAVREAVSIKVAVAGGINSETAPKAIEYGADIVIVGGAVIKAPDATAATRAIIEAMRTGQAVETELFRRGGEADIASILAKCSPANISDAMHRRGWLPGILPLKEGYKMVGPALTVWAYPGDWSKPVQAIDEAEPGTVLVIDVRGEAPAVWGAEATKSCITKKLAGIVIYGAMRDTAEIKELGIPAFTKIITPSAGDPKGMGMIGVPLKIGETAVRPGDWVVGDDDGVVVIPREQAVEIANRSLAVVERESRELSEIEGGRTLGEIAELTRWDQKR